MFMAPFEPTLTLVESGEKLIAISMPEYIITKAPAPLDWTKVARPLLGTPPRAIAVTFSAPNLDGAKTFIDYWLSDEAMSILAENVG